MAGTTRDAIDTRIEFEGREVVLVDTAGLRRRTKVAGTVDYYAQLRSEQAAERADVAIVVCDASEGVTSEDLRVAELAMRSQVRDRDRAQQVGRRPDRPRGRQGPGGARSCASARGCWPCRPRPAAGCKRLVAEAISLADRSAQRIPTPELNRFLADLQVAARAAGRARQAAAHVLHDPVRDAARRASPSRSTTAAWSTRDYAYFLENRLRDRYGLQGVPLVIDFKTSRGRS